jgi:glycolate oxidase FAD binding subunit
VSAVAGHRGVLAEIVGNAHVRDAADADAVAGVRPSLVVEPGDEEQVAAVLACASRDGLAVVARGGGTKLDWGAPPRRCDVVLSTARLDAVVEHEPGDLVCVVQAGVRLESLQRALAPHGQGLMLDPRHGVEATVGGIVAAGAHGPLRTGYGTARDLVIGARFVLADGTVGHSGGKVVKNVAGYDVAKLLVGSLGTLAVVTQVALRLHPLPRSSRTLLYSGLDAAGADAAWREVERAPVAASAVATLWPQGALLVRLDGTPEGVAAQLPALPAPSGLLGEPEAESAWADAAASVWADHAPVAAVSVPRRHLAALPAHLPGPAVVLPSLGLAEVRLGDDTAPEQVATLRSWAESRGGHLVLRRPTPRLAPHTWPHRPGDDAALDLMRALKCSLDPGDTLAPGRHLGGI